MTGQEFGVRYRRSDGTTLDSFDGGWTLEGAEHHVARAAERGDAKNGWWPVAVAAVVRDVGESRPVGDVTEPAPKDEK